MKNCEKYKKLSYHCICRLDFHFSFKLRFSEASKFEKKSPLGFDVTEQMLKPCNMTFFQLLRLSQIISYIANFHPQRVKEGVSKSNKEL